MRRSRSLASTALAPLALALLAAPARADDLAGTWRLEGRGWLLQKRAATLELEAAAGGAYKARRTVTVDGRARTLDGTARRRGPTLEVSFPRPGGLAGSLLGSRALAPWTGRYLLTGGRLTGGCHGPGPGGSSAWTFESGTRTALPAATGAGAIARTPARLEGRLRVDGERLVDPLGRTVILRGANVGSKAAPFLPAHTDADALALRRATGATFVRLFIAWRGIEPAPLRYDAAYLDAVVAAVRRFRAQGLYVLVDLHQDVWGGPLASHGAPDWATLEAGARPLSLPSDAPWQARYLDKRAWGSFEALWADRVVPATGLGLQEHFTRAWVEVAKRLAGEDGVVGYDLLNEPFFGKELRSAAVHLAAAGAPSLLRVGAVAGWRALTTDEELSAAAGAELLKLLRDPARFDRVARAFAGPTARVEERLAALYGRVGAAIHQVDPGRPIFIESLGLTGVGVPSRLPRPVRPDGRPLDAVVLAPHLYDAFVDSGQPYDGDPRRVARALERHLERGRALGVPVVVGEWGHLSPAAGDPAGFARDVTRLLDDAQVGWAYWAHEPGRETGLMAHTSGPYPARLAGRLVRFAFDPAASGGAGRLEVTLVADPRVAAPTVVALPATRYPGAPRLTLRGARAEAAFDPALGAVLLWAGEAGEVTLVVER